MRGDKNITDSVFLVAFYDNEVASGLFDILKHVICCHVTKVLSFFRDTIVER